ncbi:hypothetical protein Ssi02_47130 [Sinosporangium siamense]|uniref:Uncharacterized protein n=1 Tax=Sinosporangium siamense TaxID=1367973 RepID=A0A919RJM7_9ACTN|nr:hypothetical protein Ssi02_47130 [Sinosporangium siamense]
MAAGANVCVTSIGYLRSGVQAGMVIPDAVDSRMESVRVVARDLLCACRGSSCRRIAAEGDGLVARGTPLSRRARDLPRFRRAMESPAADDGTVSCQTSGAESQLWAARRTNVYQ